MTTIWLWELFSDGLIICKQLFTFQKRKPHQACLTFDKRLFLLQTKFTQLTSMLLLLKLSVKITYFEVKKTALNEKKKWLPGNKDDIRSFFSLTQMGTVSIASWTLLRWHCVYITVFSSITTSHAKLYKFYFPWMKKEIHLFLAITLRKGKMQRWFIHITKNSAFCY